MEKILIATRNKDKFDIVKRILSSINNNYEYYSLYDIKDFVKDDKEIGDIKNRAYNKAKQVFLSIKDNNFEYIIGIDDGIKIRGKIIEDVKKYIKDIVDDKFLIDGEQIEVVRAYCFMDKDGNSNCTITEIPFIYQRLNRKMDIEYNTFPLNFVLKALNSSKTIDKMDKEENNIYYLKYSKAKLKEVFK